MAQADVGHESVTFESLILRFLDLCRLAQEEGVQVAYEYDKREWEMVRTRVESKDKRVDPDQIFSRLDTDVRRDVKEMCNRARTDKGGKKSDRTSAAAHHHQQRQQSGHGQAGQGHSGHGQSGQSQKAAWGSSGSASRLPPPPPPRQVEAWRRGPGRGSKRQRGNG